MGPITGQELETATTIGKGRQYIWKYYGNRLRRRKEGEVIKSTGKQSFHTNEHWINNICTHTKLIDSLYGAEH
jgi:hypothetical protein